MAFLVKVNVGHSPHVDLTHPWLLTDMEEPQPKRRKIQEPELGTPFSNIPQEIALAIVGLLSGSDILNFKLVCKNWNRVLAEPHVEVKLRCHLLRRLWRVTRDVNTDRRRLARHKLLLASELVMCNSIWMPKAHVEALDPTYDGSLELKSVRELFYIHKCLNKIAAALVQAHNELPVDYFPVLIKWYPTGTMI